MPPGSFQVVAAGRTDPGLVRKNNEDAFMVAALGSDSQSNAPAASTFDGAAGVLLAVSDGLGGANAGEVASSMSIREVLHGLRSSGGDASPVEERLRTVIARASEEVRLAGERPGRDGMGATLTAVLIENDRAYLAQIGDSRAYLLRQRKLRQLTHDQTYVQSLVDAGAMTKEQAETSPRKNIVLQAMGQDDPVRADVGHLALAPGDRLLLCSDGLTNELADDRIAQLLGGEADVERAAAALIAAARRSGARDNVTAVVAEIR
jgi:PPM family protein phosphatase